MSVDEARTEIENGRTDMSAKYNVQSQKQSHHPSVNMNVTGPNVMPQTMMRPSRFSYNPYPQMQEVNNRGPKRYPGYMRQEPVLPQTKSVNDLFIR